MDFNLTTLLECHFHLLLHVAVLFDFAFDGLKDCALSRRLNDERRRIENLSAPKLESPKYVTAADFAELRAELTASLTEKTAA